MGRDPQPVLGKQGRRKESAQKNEMKAVTQETYADAGLRQAERMLLSLKESLSEKETRRYNIMQDLEAAKQPGGQEKELLEDIRALELAAAEIDRLAKEYYEDSLDGLGSAVSKWMSQLTAGKYDHAIVKEDGSGTHDMIHAAVGKLKKAMKQ